MKEKEKRRRKKISVKRVLDRSVCREVLATLHHLPPAGAISLHTGSCIRGVQALTL